MGGGGGVERGSEREREKGRVREREERERENLGGRAFFCSACPRALEGKALSLPFRSLSGAFFALPFDRSIVTRECQREFVKKGQRGLRGRRHGAREIQSPRL